jgi:hypothetical protein
MLGNVPERSGARATHRANRSNLFIDHQVGTGRIADTKQWRLCGFHGAQDWVLVLAKPETDDIGERYRSAADCGLQLASANPSVSRH